MEKIKCSEVIEATGGKLVSGNCDTDFVNVSTDSRTIKENELFIPIRGEKFDGHDFIEDALKAGAAGVLAQRDINAGLKERFSDRAVIRVEDTLKALRDLAKYYRSKFRIPFVGITGSVGKTTTKDMIASVLMQEYKVLKTEGNFNNEIGLPLTVFNLDSSHEAAVLEMGMNALGEISRLTAIARPRIAVITNIGLAHIGKLGSRQNILKAKMEILEGVPKDGLVVLNGDDSLLYGLKGFLDRRTVYYGMGEELDYQAYNIKNAGEAGGYFDINIKGREYKIHVPLPGVHNVYNALAAIAVGIELGIPAEKIARGIESFSSAKMRLNIVFLNGIKIINDAYNASPQSMEAALRVLKDMKDAKSSGRKIAVLGDMLELGEWSYNSHYNIGKFAVSLGIDYIITVGENAKAISEGAIQAGALPERVKWFTNNEEAAEFLNQILHPEDIVLVKGSRGMKMEEIVQRLTK